MYFSMKAIAFAIICFAYATGTSEAVNALCNECRILYGKRIVALVQLLGIVIYILRQ